MTTHRRLAAFLALMATATVLSGCASTGTDAPATSGGAATPAHDEPPAAAGAAYSATDVCAYLEGEIPALKEVGSPVGRHANLAGKLATFFESHGKPENGAVLDAATKAECPAVRTEVLTLIEVDSFSSF